MEEKLIWFWWYIHAIDRFLCPDCAESHVRKPRYATRGNVPVAAPTGLRPKGYRPCQECGRD